MVVAEAHELSEWLSACYNTHEPDSIALSQRSDVDRKPPNLSVKPDFYSNGRKTAEKFYGQPKTDRKKRRFTGRNFRIIAP